MEEKKHTRKNIFSNPAIQGRILILFFILAALLIATNWTMSCRALSRLGQNVMELSSEATYQRDVTLLLKQQQAVLTIQFVIYSLLSFVLVALGAVVLSHRIGGPLHHLTTYCRGVVHGTTKPQAVKFRKRDIPQDVATAFNEFQRHHGIVPAASDAPKANTPDSSTEK
jgi:hypothetical protein